MESDPTTVWDQQISKVLNNPYHGPKAKNLKTYKEFPQIAKTLTALEKRGQRICVNTQCTKCT
jgi:hypothetical protein